jgi:hypothetical protein
VFGSRFSVTVIACLWPKEAEHWRFSEQNAARKTSSFTEEHEGKKVGMGAERFLTYDGVAGPACSVGFSRNWAMRRRA